MSLVPVTQKEFYAALDAFERQRGVGAHPTIVSKWSDTTGYTSEWRTTDVRRELFGVTTGGPGYEHPVHKKTYHIHVS